MASLLTVDVMNLLVRTSGTSGYGAVHIVSALHFACKAFSCASQDTCMSQQMSTAGASRHATH